MKRILKGWAKTWFREATVEFLAIHKHGDYQYRNPDSVYVHRYKTFVTYEDMMDWFENNISKNEQKDWSFYEKIEIVKKGD